MTPRERLAAHVETLLDLPGASSARAVRIRRTPDLEAYVSVELERGGQRVAVGFRRDELDALGRAVAEARRQLVGHPAQDPKGIDPVLLGERAPGLSMQRRRS